MSSKSKSDATKSTLDTVKKRGDSKCWAREQDPYRHRKAGGTARKKDGTIWGFSRNDTKLPGKTKVERYPFSANRHDSDESLHRAYRVLPLEKCSPS